MENKDHFKDSMKLTSSHLFGRSLASPVPRARVVNMSIIASSAIHQASIPYHLIVLAVMLTIVVV